jgi:uncharacterized membrane protein HdeD (DUF308 family)
MSFVRSLQRNKEYIIIFTIISALLIYGIISIVFSQKDKESRNQSIALLSTGIISFIFGLLIIFGLIALFTLAK